ncbi:MAG TPA: hypothetical protein VFX21_14660, partial [Acidimicrobiia bacterium]|nr:hypothetical protein [Acidimicrobiia bacterium]
MGTTDIEPAARYTLDFANTEVGAISFTDAFRQPTFAVAPVEVSLVEREPEPRPAPVALASVEVAPPVDFADAVAPAVDVAPVEVAPVEVAPVEVAPVEVAREQEHFSDEAPVSAEPQEAIMASEPEPAVAPWLVLDNPDIATHAHEVIAAVAQAEAELRDAQVELEQAESAALAATEHEVDVRRRVEKTEYDVHQQGTVLDRQTEELLRARALVLDKELEARRFELSEREQMELAVAAQRRAQAEDDARRIAEEARAAAAAAEARI